MTPETKFRSLPELFTSVKESAARKEPRDYVTDSREFLHLLRLGEEKRHTVYLQNPIPDLPTLVVANHYVRPLYRRSLRLPSSFF